jgi:hypothetical protein
MVMFSVRCVSGGCYRQLGDQSVANWKGCERKRSYLDLRCCAALDCETEKTQDKLENV